MSLSVYTLIGAALLVLAGPSDAEPGLGDCPLSNGGKETECGSDSSLNPVGSTPSISLPDWADMALLIVTVCLLTFGSIFVSCLCCSCCPMGGVADPQQKQLEVVTTAMDQSKVSATPAYPSVATTTSTVSTSL
eukprot:scpid104682/ scgid21688/ 